MTGQASASDKIEITPEMVEAGSAILRGYFGCDRLMDFDSQCVGEVFQAMLGLLLSRESLKGCVQNSP